MKTLFRVTSAGADALLQYMIFAPDHKAHQDLKLGYTEIESAIKAFFSRRFKSDTLYDALIQCIVSEVPIVVTKMVVEDDELLKFQEKESTKIDDPTFIIRKKREGRYINLSTSSKYTYAIKCIRCGQSNGQYNAVFMEKNENLSLYCKWP